MYAVSGMGEPHSVSDRLGPLFFSVFQLNREFSKLLLLFSLSEDGYFFRFSFACFMYFL